MLWIEAKEIVEDADKNGCLDSLGDKLKEAIITLVPDVGEWKWNIEGEDLECPFCGKVFEIKYLWEVGEDLGNPDKIWIIKYGPPCHCPSCGAILGFDESMETEQVWEWAKSRYEGMEQ